MRYLSACCKSQPGLRRLLWCHSGELEAAPVSHGARGRIGRRDGRTLVSTRCRSCGLGGREGTRAWARSQREPARPDDVRIVAVIRGLAVGAEREVGAVASRDRHIRCGDEHRCAAMAGLSDSRYVLVAKAVSHFPSDDTRVMVWKSRAQCSSTFSYGMPKLREPHHERNW